MTPPLLSNFAYALREILLMQREADRYAETIILWDEYNLIDRALIGAHYQLQNSQAATLNILARQFTWNA